MMRRFALPVLPLILGVILGPLMEFRLREAMAISGGDVSGAVERAARHRDLRDRLDRWWSAPFAVAPACRPTPAALAADEPDDTTTPTRGEGAMR